jgi:microcystin-dependent protein
MSRGRWLTPASLPSTTRCYSVELPDSIEFLSLLKGAIDDLRFVSNWEEVGITPQETADAFAAVFDTIAECTGGSGLVTGEIIAYATSTPPTGTLACDGTTYLRVDYPDLYSVLASSFISDADHFIVPDLRGRSIIGIGTGTGLTARSMNASGGEENHALSEAELASHSHTIPVSAFGSGGSLSQILYASGVGAPSSKGTNADGSGSAHNTMHPFRALGYAIVT